MAACCAKSARQISPRATVGKGGAWIGFHGGGFSVERLMHFAEREYERSSRTLVPPEPHVATPHDQTFLLTIGTVAVGAAVLWVVDAALGRYYAFQKRKQKRAAKRAASLDAKKARSHAETAADGASAAECR